MSGKNCRDSEKLRRIRMKVGNEVTWHSSWSDHIADIPILKAAQTPHIISPKPEHIPIFKATFGDNVEILYWSAK